MMSSRPSDHNVRELIEMLKKSFRCEPKTCADAERWLLEHEGDNDLLKRAAIQRGSYFNSSVLWYAVCCSPQVAFIKRILQLAPDTIKRCCSFDTISPTPPLPLHAAIEYRASYEVIKLLLDALCRRCQTSRWVWKVAITFGMLEKGHRYCFKVVGSTPRRSPTSR